MPKAPFITIGIASYNYARYLLKGFEAIKMQAFSDFEVLYIDDCSNDNSVEIIRDIILHNPKMNIRLIENQTNMGIIYTKNSIIKEAKGEYLMLCDADDWMAKNCLIELALAAKKSHADRVISEVADVDEREKVLQIQDIPDKPSKWLWNLHHGCLYRRKLLIDHDIEIKSVPDDVYLTTKFNEHARNIIWIREVLYYWRVHTDSAGRKAENDIHDIVTNLNHAVLYIDETAKKVELNEPGAKDALELLILKVFYLYLFNGTRYYSLRKKMFCYVQMREIVRKNHPEYLQNKLVRSSKTAGLRSYAYRIIKTSTLLEKLHMMPLALCGYHFISKIHYFDQ